MSHTDYIESAPEGFKIIGHTTDCPVAAMANEEKKSIWSSIPSRS